MAASRTPRGHIVARCRDTGRLLSGHCADTVEPSKPPPLQKPDKITMNTSTDYTKLAASLDYAALEKKLAQLSERQPPKRRKHIADVLEPLRERLLSLSHNGWSSHDIAGELTAAGIPVSPARLRECLNRWAEGGDRTGTRRRRHRPVTVLSPPPSVSPASQSSPPKKPSSGVPSDPFALR
jgi:hypothetical protein